jgi:hypothetical protein
MPSDETAADHRDAAKGTGALYGVLPEPDGQRFLVMDGEGGPELPWVEAGQPYLPRVDQLNDAVRERFGVEALTLYCAYLHKDREARRMTGLYVMESHSPDWSPPEGTRWAGEEVVPELRLPVEEFRPAIMRWQEEERTGRVPARRAPWSRKGWYDGAVAWTRQAVEGLGLSLAGRMEQVKHWDISTVLRVPTPGGDYYFKAVPGIFAHEPRITAELARLYPGVVPEPVAWTERDGEGWMLMQSFGDTVIWDDTGPALEEALRVLARMQIEAVGRVEHLLAEGARDRDVRKLPEQVAALLEGEPSRSMLEPGEVERLRALLPVIASDCEALAAGPIPQTLLHGDFHGGNVALVDERPLIFDWTDACIAHPFFDLATVLDTDNAPESPEVAERLRDVYLGEWSEYGSPEKLRAAFEGAYRLAPLHHAISYAHINTILEEATLEDIGPALPYFLRLFLKGFKGILQSGNYTRSERK